ncbi:MAG: hypothetical protein U0822_26850 [Anaerolineae bacterium]
MNTILTRRTFSLRIVVGALLAGLILVAAVLALTIPRAASSAPDLGSRAALSASTAYTRYLDMKERQAEQRDTTVVARASSITAPGSRERYEAMKERQAEQRDTMVVARASSITAPGSRERYEAMKERQSEAR